MDRYERLTTSPRYLDTQRAKVARRRALTKTDKVDRVLPSEVFERDRWTCQLCGARLNPATKHPHPRSASMDHIVPLARGGAHTKANVQCACLSCNVRKGARVVLPEQLRLIG